MPYNQHDANNKNNINAVDFRAKLGRARESRIKKSPTSFIKQMKNLSQIGGQSKSGSGFRFGRGTIKFEPRFFSQRVVIKSRVVRIRNRSMSATIEHVGYLLRDGVGIDSKAPQGFNQDLELSQEDLNSWTKSLENDRHHFRFIVAPDQAMELDLRQYTRDFMKQVEVDLATKLQWSAVAHYNTDNPHVHILLRGVDEAGADLVIKRDYMARGMRISAEDIATKELGIRTELDVQKEIKASITKQRFTSIDGQLLGDSMKRIEIGNEGFIDLRDVPPANYEFALRSRGNKLARLEFLDSLGLATQVEDGLWKIDGQFKSKLRSMSIRDDVIKTMHKRMRGMDNIEIGDVDTAAPIIFDKDNPPTKLLKGRVVYKGLMDELYDSKYILLKSDSGEIYQVSLTGFTEFKDDETSAGKRVSLAVKERDSLTKTDRNIAAFVENTDGIYDTATHEAFVRENIKLPSHVSPSDYVQNHRRRIVSLARMELIEEIELEKWRVPKDLQQKLQQRTVNFLMIEGLDRGIDLGVGLGQEH